MVEKSTFSEQDRIEWSSWMKTLYKEDGYSDGRIYRSPDDIIVRGAFVNWLLNPPALARTDLEQKYVVTESSQSADIADRKVVFQVHLVQRLQHAETVGRWGASGAKVGGTSLVVPHAINGTSHVVIDLKRGQVEIQQSPVLGVNARQIFRV